MIYDGLRLQREPRNYAKTVLRDTRKEILKQQEKVLAVEKKDKLYCAFLEVLFSQTARRFSLFPNYIATKCVQIGLGKYYKNPFAPLLISRALYEVSL